MDRYIRRPEVSNRTGLPRSTIYAKIADGTFPKPAKLGKRAVGWLEKDIQTWIESRASAPDTEV